MIYPNPDTKLFLLFSVFEEPEDPSNRSFFSEIISSISDVKFSHSGRYMMTRDYLSVKIWDLNMENRPVETYQVFAVCFERVYTCGQYRGAQGVQSGTFLSESHGCVAVNCVKCMLFVHDCG